MLFLYFYLYYFLSYFFCFIFTYFFIIYFFGFSFFFIIFYISFVDSVSWPLVFVVFGVLKFMTEVYLESIRASTMELFCEIR